MSSPTGSTPPQYTPLGEPITTESTGPGLSEPQRLINTFIAPPKTFADIRRNASWWVPFILISICAVGMFVTIEKKVGFDRVAHTMLENNKGIQRLDPAQQEQAYSRTATGLKIGTYTAPVFILLYVVIIAAVLMASFNFIMDAQVPFSRAMAIVMYGWLPGIITSILTIITLMAGDPEGFRMQNPVGTNPAYFLDATNTSKFVYSFLTAFDVVSLWMVAIIGLGFALNAKKKISTGSAIAVVAAWFFLYKLASAGFASLGG